MLWYVVDPCMCVGAVVHSLLCWDIVLPGTGKKGREAGVSIAPFQKQLSYSREGVGLEDVQISLRRTVDPVRLTTLIACILLQVLSFSMLNAPCSCVISVSVVIVHLVICVERVVFLPATLDCEAGLSLGWPPSSHVSTLLL